MRWNPQYHTACQIQKKILAAMGLEMQQANRVPGPMPEEESRPLKASELCSLTKAWTELEERKRILRMKPKPRDVAVETKKKVARATFTE